MKKSFLAILYLSINLSVFSQSYTFSHLFGGYNNLSGSTSLTNGMVWNDTDFSIPLGFNFDFMGFTTDSLWLEYPGGNITTGGCAQDSITSYLLAFSAKLVDRGYNIQQSLSSISYKIEGNVGSQIAKIEWNNAGLLLGGVGADSVYTDYVNFQVWLFEGTNVIEIRYGPNSVAAPESVYEGESGPAVFLKGPYDCNQNELVPGGELIMLDGSPFAPTAELWEPGDSYGLDQTMLATTLYRFTPVSTTIIESSVNDQIKIYPNPTNDFFSIDFGDSNNDFRSISLFDMGGTLIKKWNSFEAKMNIEEIPMGLYLVDIELSNSTHHQLKLAKY